MNLVAICSCGSCGKVYEDKKVYLHDDNFGPLGNDINYDIFNVP